MNSKHLDGTSFFHMDLEKGAVKSIQIPPINDITKSPPTPPVVVHRQNFSTRNGDILSRELPPNGFRYHL